MEQTMLLALAWYVGVINKLPFLVQQTQESLP
jgi:hypothetical protein